LTGFIYFKKENIHVYSLKLLMNNLLQRNKIPIPPTELQESVGGAGFEAIGKQFFQYFQSYCALQPHEKILDVGCGCGRIAIPLTPYLANGGCYAGFDINRNAIAWCQENITSRFPNFHFTYVNLYNHAYNPGGTILSKDFVFPYRDNFFDFVNLSSVFTHLLPQDMEHYLSEIHRVMKPNGRCMITFFLLNEESLSLIRAKTPELDFKYDLGVYRTINQNTPEAAVAYKEEYIRQLFEQNRFELRTTVLYGSWCARTNPVSYQDMIIAYKK
jgi:ubiquinone/menaquinone biosynthesis C-methylase UbiE